MFHVAVVDVHGRSAPVSRPPPNGIHRAMGLSVGEDWLVPPLAS
jgi:hypothetical protein